MGDLNSAISDFRTAVSLPQEYKDDQTQELLIEIFLNKKDYNELVKGETFFVSDLDDKIFVVGAERRGGMSNH
jgi:hypothetical protein